MKLLLSVLHNVQNYENSTTMGRPGMNKKIVNSYLMADGSRFTDKAGYETMTFDQECPESGSATGTNHSYPWIYENRKYKERSPEPSLYYDRISPDKIFDDG